MMWRVVFAFLAGPALADSVVATRPIAANATVSADDVTLVAMDIQGAAAALDQVIGQTATAPIAAGRAVQTSQISGRVHIARNTVVSVVLQAGGLEIRTEGRALAAGSLGDVIEIMNLSSRSRIKGTIIDAGKVRVVTGP
ncbi:MAG: flagellar basal body P-ring formation chaperone FlgA [Cypionkella sp.]|nr:flagellar basal body P-ring formation chaperone FlgA [Cypionkella sp.]